MEDEKMTASVIKALLNASRVEKKVCKKNGKQTANDNDFSVFLLQLSNRM